MPQQSRFRSWLERSAGKPWAMPALCSLSFLDACVSPIIPEVLLAPLCIARPERRWWYALWCGVWSVLGGVFGYGLGLVFWEAGLREAAFTYIPGFTPEGFAQVAGRYGESAFLWVFLAGFTPLPFKLFTVAAGVCHEHVGLTTFILASAASRLPRFFLTVALIRASGPLARRLMVLPKWAIAGVVIALLAAWLI